MKQVEEPKKKKFKLNLQEYRTRHKIQNQEKIPQTEALSRSFESNKLSLQNHDDSPVLKKMLSEDCSNYSYQMAKWEKDRRQKSTQIIQSIGFLLFTINGDEYGGTGFLIGPRLVITAAHNLVHIKEDSICESQNIRFYPGLHNNTTKTAKFIKVFGFRYPQQFLQSHERKLRGQFDYAMLILQKPIKLPKYYKIGYDFRGSATANVTGYPKDKVQQAGPSTIICQYGERGNIDSDNRMIYYQFATAEGQSGSPICIEFTKNLWFAVGVHSGALKRQMKNAGCCFTEDTIEVLQNWMKQLLKAHPYHQDKCIDKNASFIAIKFGHLKDPQTNTMVLETMSQELEHIKSNIDSLKNEKPVNTIKIVQLYFSGAKIYRQNCHYFECLQWLLEANSYLTEYEDEFYFEQIKLSKQISVSYRCIHQYKEAGIYGQKALQMAYYAYSNNTENETVAILQNNMGTIYQKIAANIQNKQKRMECFKMAYDYYCSYHQIIKILLNQRDLISREKERLKLLQAGACTNLANCIRILKSSFIFQSLNLLKEALQIYQQTQNNINTEKNKMICISNISECQFILKNYKNWLQYSKQYLQILKRFINKENRQMLLIQFYNPFIRLLENYFNILKLEENSIERQGIIRDIRLIIFDENFINEKIEEIQAKFEQLIQTSRIYA